MMRTRFSDPTVRDILQPGASLSATEKGNARANIGVAQSDPFTTSVGVRNRIRVFAGIDSLTDGGGNGSSNYRTTLTPLLKAKYGDGGYGYINAENAGAADALLLGNYGKSAGMNYISGLAWNDAKRVLCLGGRGLYSASATGTDNWGIADYTNAYGYDGAILYVEFLTSGASFTLRQNNEPGGSSVAFAASTYGLNTIVPIHRIMNASYNMSLLCEGITGDIIFHGYEFTKSAATAQGVTFTNLGVGGAKASDWAGLNDARQRQWMKLLQPDVFILNCGMNDRATAAIHTYAVSLNTIVSRIQECQNTRVLLVRPNDSNDTATTNLKDYDKAIIATARQYHCAYIDDRTALGAYAAMNSAGYISADGIHPTPTGNVARANAYNAVLSLG